jgi:hypothetical protein
MKMKSFKERKLGSVGLFCMIMLIKDQTYFIFNVALRNIWHGADVLTEPFAIGRYQRTILKFRLFDGLRIITVQG